MTTTKGAVGDTTMEADAREEGLGDEAAEGAAGGAWKCVGCGHVVEVLPGGGECLCCGSATFGTIASERGSGDRERECIYAAQCPLCAAGNVPYCDEEWGGWVHLESVDAPTVPGSMNMTRCVADTMRQCRACVSLRADLAAARAENTKALAAWEVEFDNIDAQRERAEAEAATLRAALDVERSAVTQLRAALEAAARMVDEEREAWDEAVRDAMDFVDPASKPYAMLLDLLRRRGIPEANDNG